MFHDTTQVAQMRGVNLGACSFRHTGGEHRTLALHLRQAGQSRTAEQRTHHQMVRREVGGRVDSAGMPFTDLGIVRSVGLL